ncbi:MAG: ester cyclase [Chitinophagaceae bacterium]|nr:ester cyclase [Chitinophagaceae bacterium]
MKKNLFAALAVLTCMSMSCNNNGTSNTDDSQAQKNIKASDVVAKAFETGDVSGIDSVVAEDFVDHTDQGDKKGRDSLKAMVNFVHSNFKDMKMEKVHELADGDYVYTRMRYTGTSDGTMGMPKGPYDMHAIEVTKFRNGKAVEHWAFMDMQSMAKMMTQQPNMNNMSKADSTR